MDRKRHKTACCSPFHPIFIIIRHPRATAVPILCRPHWEKTWLYYRSVEVWALHGTEWASKILENHGNWIKFRKMDPILFPTTVPTIPCLSFTGNKKGKDTHDLQQYSTLKTACKQNESFVAFSLCLLALRLSICFCINKRWRNSLVHRWSKLLNSDCMLKSEFSVID